MKLILFLLLLSGELFANTISIRDFTFIDDENLIDVDLKKIEPIKKSNSKIFRKKKVGINNQSSFIELIGGISEESYPKKNGIYVERITPFVLVGTEDWWNKYLGYHLDLNLSLSGPVARQNILIGLSKNKYEAYFFGQVGEKINFKEQIDNGYFFFNYGIGGKIIGKRATLVGDGYFTMSESKQKGFNLKILFPLGSRYWGLYGAMDQYYKTDAKAERDGQTTVKGGIVLYY